MKKIAFTPFNDPDLLRGVYLTIRQHNSRWRSFFGDKFEETIKVFVNGSSDRILESVRYDQQLYIFGHGYPGDANIYGGGASLPLRDLAWLLSVLGLSLSHQKVKLHACSGGVGGDGSMAAQLRNHMASFGFTQVTVYGYTEDLERKTGVSGARLQDVRVGFGPAAP